MLGWHLLAFLTEDLDLLPMRKYASRPLVFQFRFRFVSHPGGTRLVGRCFFSGAAHGPELAGETGAPSTTTGTSWTSASSDDMFKPSKDVLRSAMVRSWETVLVTLHMVVTPLSTASSGVTKPGEEDILFEKILTNTPKIA